MWSKCSSLKQVKSNFDIYQSIMHTSKEIIVFLKWAKHGISIVGDVSTSEGVFLSEELVAHTYKFNINVVEYFRLKSLIKKFISKYSYGGTFGTPRPPISFQIQRVLQSQGYSKVF